MKRSAEQILSPNSLKNNHAAKKQTNNVVDSNKIEINDQYERKGYNIILFKNTLEEISEQESDVIKESLLEYQLTNNIAIEVNKNYLDPINRSLIIRVPNEEQISKVTDAVIVLPQLSGSFINVYLPHESLPQNRCYIFLEKFMTKYAVKSSIMKMLKLATTLSETDITLFAPAKTLKGN